MANYKKTLIILPLLLAFGIVMVLAMKMMVSMETGTIIAALLVPLLAYLLLSGTVEELGFAGVKAKFISVASTEITISDLGKMTPSAQDFYQVGQEGGAALEKMMNTYQLSEAKPIVLNFKLGRDDYKKDDISEFIKNLAMYRSFKFIVFLDRYDRVIAYMPFWAARLLLTDQVEGVRLINLLNKDDVEGLLKLPKVVTKPLSVQSTNTEALRQMMDLNLDALVVVDADKKLTGVVEREQLVSKMMLTLVDKPLP